MSMVKSSIHHSFNIHLATVFGCANIAAFYHHIVYWIDYNQRMNRNFHEGRYWTYQTFEELHAHFPYRTVKQLRLIVDKLVEWGVLLKGNFNQNKYDHTIWYSIDFEKVKSMCPKGQIDVPEKADRNSQKGEPIPDNIPYNKERVLRGTHVKLSDEEYNSLEKEHGKEKTDEIIERINDYCVNNRPQGYTDYKVAFRTFLKNYNLQQEKKHDSTRNKRKPHNGKAKNPEGFFANGVRVE